MEEKTRVSVKIYGQEYKISGDAPRDYILQLADYVDSKIVEMAKNMKQYTTPMITVLAAVNIADEYYQARKKASDAQSEINRLSIEVRNKNNFLEKAKESYIQYKQDAERHQKQASELESQLREKDEQYQSLISEFETLKNKSTNSKNETETLMQTIERLEAELHSRDNEMNELKQANQELENNYFDTQMMNVQLKKELDDISKKVAE